MLIATFGPSTGWAGKTITYEDEQFVLEGHGPVAPGAIVEYDDKGHLEWSSEGLRQWVHEQAAAMTPSPPPPGERAAPHRTWRRRPQTPASAAGSGSGPAEEIEAASSAASEEATEAPEAASASAEAGPAKVMPVATFRAGTLYADKRIVHERGALVIEGEGALTAAEVMELDGEGQLAWADEGTRAWIGSRAARAKVDLRSREQLEKARKQYEAGKYKAAVSTLCDVMYDARPIDLQAARGILELVAQLGPRVDGWEGNQCEVLVANARDACRGGRVLFGSEAAEAAAHAAELAEAPPAPVVALPLAPAPPPEPSPATRKRLDKARRQTEKGKSKAAVSTLRKLGFAAGTDDAAAARGIIELASEIGTHVEGSLGEECADLVARSRKALESTRPEQARVAAQQEVRDLTLLWVVAFSPLLQAILGAVAPPLGFLAGLGAFFMLLYDRQLLKRAHIDTNWLLLAAFLLPPAYLDIRLRRTDQSPGPLYAWLSCFVIVVGVAALVLLAQSATPY